MFCTKCGYECSTPFCGKCGAPMSQPSVSTEPTPIDQQSQPAAPPEAPLIIAATSDPPASKVPTQSIPETPATVDGTTPKAASSTNAFSAQDESTDAQQPRKKISGKKLGLILGGAVVAVGLVVGVIFAFGGGGNQVAQELPVTSVVPVAEVSAPTPTLSGKTDATSPDPLGLYSLIGQRPKDTQLSFGGPSAKEFAGTALSQQGAEVQDVSLCGINANAYVLAFGGVIYHASYIANQRPDSEIPLLADAFLKAVQYYQPTTQLPITFIKNGEKMALLSTSAESIAESLRASGYYTATLGSNDIRIHALSPIGESDSNWFMIKFSAPCYDPLQLYTGTWDRPQLQDVLDLSLWTKKASEDGGSEYFTTGSVSVDGFSLATFVQVSSDAYGAVRKWIYTFDSIDSSGTAEAEQQETKAFRTFFEELISDLGYPVSTDIDGLTFVTEDNFDELLDQTLDRMSRGHESVFFIWDDIRGISPAVQLDNEDSSLRMTVFFLEE